MCLTFLLCGNKVDENNGCNLLINTYKALRIIPMFINIVWNENCWEKTINNFLLNSDWISYKTVTTEKNYFPSYNARTGSTTWPYPLTTLNIEEDSGVSENSCLLWTKCVIHFILVMNSGVCSDLVSSLNLSCFFKCPGKAHVLFCIY